MFILVSDMVTWPRDRVGCPTFGSFSLLMFRVSFVSPLVGGTLSRPQDRWPHLFSHAFWAKYPYFLPCVVVAAYCCVCFVTVAVFLEEVRPSPIALDNGRATLCTDSDSSAPTCKD